MLKRILIGLAALLLPATAGAQIGGGVYGTASSVSSAAIIAALGGTPTLQEGSYITDNVLVGGAGATGVKDSGVALKTTMVAKSVWGNNSSSTAAPSELTTLTMGDGNCTTPTYSFNASTSTGFASLTANETDLCVGGNRFIRFGSSNATNYFRFTVASVPTIQAIGTNMDMQFSGSGTGGVKLMTNAAGATILRALGVASTANSLTVTSAATGNPVLISAAGDANAGISITPNGSGVLKLYGMTLSASTGTFTLTNAKTLAVTNTVTIGGTDSANFNVGAGAVMYMGNSGGTGDALTFTPSPAISAYVTGGFYMGKATAANTVTNPTVNISGLGTKTIVKRAATALAASDYVSGKPLLLWYDGTNMILLNPAAL